MSEDRPEDSKDYSSSSSTSDKRERRRERRRQIVEAIKDVGAFVVALIGAAHYVREMTRNPKD